ncbi:response regulator [Halobacteriovorax sp. HLS]|uniref:ATP-binding response regulator n=1 Tax=Halobacteriovorax sp. HLS TaxID=2234000 RepID=UPI000FD89327|nr:response regulator [Halobacteriovorax sp. HLS]
MRKILLIEDDDEIVELIRSILKNELVEIIHVNDGSEGLETILEQHDNLDLVIVDRVLPGLDGIELLKKVRLSNKNIQTPIVMSTSSAKDDQVSQGIQAGAFYYLIKPLRKKSFLTVVNRAFNHIDNIRSGHKYYSSFRSGLSYFTNAQAKIKSHRNVLDLSFSLSFLFDDAPSAFRGIYELLLNSVEHGLYKLGSGKSKLVDQNKYNDFLEQSENSTPLEVNVSVSREGDTTKITIDDPGEGFAWENYLTLDPASSNSSSGRGIAYATQVCFDEITFNKKGNQVTAVMRNSGTKI